MIAFAAVAATAAAGLAVTDWVGVVRDDRRLRWIGKPGTMIALIVAALETCDAAFREWIAAEIERRAKSAFASESAPLAPDYREAGRYESWREVERSPRSATPECQRAALVLARLASLTEPRVDDALAAHERIWREYATRA